VRIYMNFRPARGPYGGGNQFLAALRAELERRGHVIVTDPRGRFEVALLNALMQDIDAAFVERIAERAPVVHRKVGYRVSGNPQMRRVADGVVWGDKLQLDFTPYLARTIFQSAYSRDVFTREGFSGPYTIIHNGVDERVFNVRLRPRVPWRRPVRRSFWDGREPLRVIVSAWSTDPNKGFDELPKVDAALDGVEDVRLELVGRKPKAMRLPNVRVLRARPPARVAEVLKRRHVLLQLARHETCSNALIEGINCGLPAIYVDSGSNAELARDYGVEYRGDLLASVAELRDRYAEIVERIADNPYRISLVAPRYEEALEQAAAGA
jgi:glycosyltransferase involved in cell wall biosynthesis